MTKLLLVEEVFEKDSFPPPKNALHGVTGSAFRETRKSDGQGMVMEEGSSDQDDDPGG